MNTPDDHGAPRGHCTPARRRLAQTGYTVARSIAWTAFLGSSTFDAMKPHPPRFLHHVALPLLLAASGCGGTSTNQPEPSSTRSPGSTSDVLPSPPKPWAQMNERERKRWMATAIMDAMAPRFQRWRPEEFARFTCASCHGEDPGSRAFRMPNPALPPLYPTGHPKQHEMVREHPEAVRFMYNQVTKPMMVLLGMPEYDPETRQGFGCFSCHPSAASEAEAPETPHADPSADDAVSVPQSPPAPAMGD